MSDKKPVKKLTIRVEEDLHKEIQHYVIDKGVTIQDLTLNFYKQLIKDHKEQ